MNLLDSQRDWLCKKNGNQIEKQIEKKVEMEKIERRNELRKKARTHQSTTHSISSLTNMKMQAISTRDALDISLLVFSSCPFVRSFFLSLSLVYLYRGRRNWRMQQRKHQSNKWALYAWCCCVKRNQTPLK